MSWLRDRRGANQDCAAQSRHDAGTRHAIVERTALGVEEGRQQAEPEKSGRHRAGDRAFQREIPVDCPIVSLTTRMRRAILPMVCPPTAVNAKKYAELQQQQKRQQRRRWQAPHSLIVSPEIRNVK